MSRYQTLARGFARCSPSHSADFGHGRGAIAAGMAPDPRASFVVASADQFARVVRGGTRAARGMPMYEAITDEQLTALQHYIRRQAETALTRKP